MITQTLPSPDALSQHHCQPCEGGVAPLTREEFTVYLPQVQNWQITEDTSIERVFTLKNFMAVIELVNKIAAIAESEGHHPDLFIHDYKKLKVSLTTHAIHGLSVNDFVLAVKIDELLPE